MKNAKRRICVGAAAAGLVTAGLLAPVGPAAALSAGIYQVATNGTAPALSATGRYVAFLTRDQLAPEDTNAVQDAYVRDVQTGQLVMVSTRGATEVDISDDGTRVAYIELLSTGGEAWVRDLTTGQLTNATRGAANLAPDSQLADLAISGNGNVVAFDTQATTLVPGTGPGRDVFVKRLDTGVLALASASPAGLPANGSSIWPSLSYDGSRVTFVSSATNIVTVGTTVLQRLYRKSLADGSVEVADLPGLNVSNTPGVDATGSRAVLQTSQASNGFPGPLQIHDFATGTTRPAMTAPSVCASSGRPKMDGLGARVGLVCSSSPVVLVVDQNSGAVVTTHGANASAVAVSADGDAFAWEDIGSRATLLQVERLSSTDDTPPTIGYSLTPPAPDGDNGWYVSDVSLSWHVLDAESTVTTTGCTDTDVTTDQGAETFACSAASDGGSAGPVTVTLKRDATPPTISATTSPSAPDGSGGWYVSSPSISYVCTDATSGVATCPDPSVVGEGATAEVSAGARDVAGNSAAARSGPFQVDLTDPTVTCPAVPTVTLHAAGASLSAAVADGQSGPVVSTVKTGIPTDSVGTGLLTVTGTDVAGRTSSAACAYRIVYGFAGFSSPVDNDVVNVAKAGRTIPLKWRVLDATGAPVAQLAVATVTSAAHACGSGWPEDAVEEFASGASGLQNLGDGYYQFNWKTPTTYAGSCRALRLDLGDGLPRTAEFRLTA